MENINNILTEFLKDSPYTEGEKKDITLYIEGLKEDSKIEILNLISDVNKIRGKKE